METNTIREEIMEIKLELLKVQKRKNRIVRAQQFEEAANLRQQANVLKMKLDDIKLALLQKLTEIRATGHQPAELIDIHEALLEFQPDDFRHSITGAGKGHEIEKCAADYWEMRNHLFQDFKAFIESECSRFQAQSSEFIREGNETAANLSLQYMHTLGIFLLRFR